MQMRVYPKREGQQQQSTAGNNGRIRIQDNRTSTAVQQKLAKTVQSKEYGKKQGQDKFTVQRAGNRTGLPGNLKAGVEKLSGLDMSDVRVHYNSSKPAGVQALAYAQGTDIYVAPGQEKHLAHEAWHVAQQKQGRVRPTSTVAGTPVNNNPGLEKEAGTIKTDQDVHLKSLDLIQLKKAYISNSQLIQRIVMPVVIGGGIALTGDTLVKFNEVITAMNLAIGPTAGIVVGVRVDDNHEPNPADTRMSSSGGIDIEVNLRKWYLDIMSVGEIVGLIAHELGVHNLADLMISPRARRREKRRNSAGRGFQVNANNRRVGVAGWSVPVTNTRDAQGRQRDHINVVRDQGGVAGNASARTRAYVDTVLNLGDNINAGSGPVATRNLKLHDLIKTFLFDYARILVTDDSGPWSTFSKASLISHVMQWYQGEMIPRHVAAHPWLMANAVHVNSGGWKIRGWLLGKLTAYLANRTLTIAEKGLNVVGETIRGLWE